MPQCCIRQRGQDPIDGVASAGRDHLVRLDLQQACRNHDVQGRVAELLGDAVARYSSSSASSFLPAASIDRARVTRAQASYFPRRFDRLWLIASRASSIASA